MKTIVSVLGTILLIGAVAFAQTSVSTSKTKKSSTDSSNVSSTTSSSSDTSASPSSNTSVKAGNSGFDDDSATASSQSSSASSSPSSAQSGSAYSTSSQSGSNSSSQSISNGPVAETVSDSSAVIGWSTSSPGNGTSVKYGSTRANMTQTAQATDGSDGKNHHVKLDGLSPSTRYYFQVMDNGQPVGGVGTFKTTAAGEQPVQSKAVIPQK